MRDSGPAARRVLSEPGGAAKGALPACTDLEDLKIARALELINAVWHPFELGAGWVAGLKHRMIANKLARIVIDSAGHQDLARSRRTDDSRRDIHDHAQQLFSEVVVELDFSELTLVDADANTRRIGLPFALA